MEEIKEIKINIPEGYEIDKEMSTFEHIVFKKKENKLPKTWEEFCENYPIKRGEYYITSYGKSVCDSLTKRHPKGDCSILPSKELAEAVLALCQLIQLRDCYNAGWEPDWKIDSHKYCICTTNDIITMDCFWTKKKIILAFKSQELRNQFYENFKDLIEIAKPLL